MDISFFNTHINPKAFNKVKEVLDSTFISEGDVVKEFEFELHNKLRLINPVAVNSCTSALHLALIEAIWLAAMKNVYMDSSLMDVWMGRAWAY